MSLIDPRARLWLPLSESAASLYPSDASGHLADPARVGATTPAITTTSTITGYARDFIRASSHGFEFTDPAGALQLTRALTIVALLRVDVSTMGSGAVGTVIQRGRGGASDPKAFELLVTISGSNARLQLRWETTAGVSVADPGVLLSWPTGQFLMVAAMREVVDGQFTVRYAINSQRVVGSSFALDCGGNLSASVSLGCGMSSPSGNTNFLDGAIDSLAVLDEAISDDEAEWLWFRIAKDQPDGVAAMRRLQPPGVYSLDPTSRVQREIEVEGAILGYTKAIARRFRDYALPDRAWGEILERWETVTQHSPKAGDWLARRRERVLSFLGTVRGFALVDVKAQLVESFDVVDDTEVAILEFDNDFTETFTSGTPSNHAKVVAGNGAWLSDAAAVAAGYQQFTATAADLRYQGVLNSGGGLYLWSLASAEDAWIHGKVDPVTTADGVIHGFAIGDAVADDWLFVGLFGNSGTTEVGRLRYSGVLAIAPATLETPWTADPTYFRIHIESPGSYLVKWGSSDAAAKAHAGEVVAGPLNPKWAGFCVVASGGASSTSPTCRFDDFYSHTPNGDQRLYWYAYRDPALPGSPDMAGASLLVQRLRPAHTVAAAIEQTSALTDDPGSSVDREPIGA